jgi:peroxiredoxin
MRTLAGLAVAAVLSVSVFAETAPKKAPEFTIVEPSGQKTLLSSTKGKVTVLTFILTTCPHCQKESEMLTKMYKEWHGRGLEVFGVAVDQDNAALRVPGFVQQFQVAYPVGYASADAMMAFQGFSAMERWVVPQVVVIDRKGMIRAQTPAMGDANLQSESYMRDFIDKLLKEGSAAPAGKAATKTASSK